LRPLENSISAMFGLVDDRGLLLPALRLQGAAVECCDRLHAGSGTEFEPAVGAVEFYVFRVLRQGHRGRAVATRAERCIRQIGGLRNPPRLVVGDHLLRHSCGVLHKPLVRLLLRPGACGQRRFRHLRDETDDGQVGLAPERQCCGGEIQRDVIRRDDRALRLFGPVAACEFAAIEGKRCGKLGDDRDFELAADGIGAA
jgi:hypothetical protein